MGNHTATRARGRSSSAGGSAAQSIATLERQVKAARADMTTAMNAMGSLTRGTPEHEIGLGRIANAQLRSSRLAGELQVAQREAQRREAARVRIAAERDVASRIKGSTPEARAHSTQSELAAAEKAHSEAQSELSRTLTEVYGTWARLYPHTGPHEPSAKAEYDRLIVRPRDRAQAVVDAAERRLHAAQLASARIPQALLDRMAWKEALPTIRASVARARSAPEAVMRAPRSESHIASGHDKLSAAYARLTPTDKAQREAQARRDRLNSAEGMQTRHEMHVLAVELDLARAQVNAATPGTPGYRAARANAAALGARVNANGQRYRDIESGKIKVGAPRTAPMTFTTSKSAGGKSAGGKRTTTATKAIDGRAAFEKIQELNRLINRPSGPASTRVASLQRQLTDAHWAAARAYSASLAAAQSATA